MQWTKIVGPAVVLVSLTTAQNLTGIYNVTPDNVAIVPANATEAIAITSPFQIYHSSFSSILGTSPSLSLVYEASFPAFHEGGIVTSLDPLTIYTSSAQFNTTSPSPSTNNKIIVISRTSQDIVTQEFGLEIVANNTAPLLLANGGFSYKDGILWAAQGDTAQNYSAALVYLPSPATSASLNSNTPPPSPSSILNNYLGNPLNSPNDIYITKSGVIYFTDPHIGYAQNIRPPPQLPGQVYGFIPGTNSIRVVADSFQAPNGIQFSPDEKTAYISDTGIAVVKGPNSTSAFRTIYAYDIITHTDQQSRIASFTNRRIFAVTPVGSPDGIKCDDKGNVWVAAGDGLNIFNPDGDLMGKILVDEGCSNFGFASDGLVFALGEKKLWLVRVDGGVNPAVRVGEKRG